VTTPAVERLPFAFRRLGDSPKYVATNQGAAFALLEDREQLCTLIDGDLSDLPEDKRDELLAKNFLAEASDRDARVGLLASRQATLIRQNLVAPSLFLIIPTLRCDHDCVYCQVSRVGVERAGYDLPLTAIDKIIDLIGAVQTPTVKIEFQGGEPLLAAPFIQEFVEKAGERLAGRRFRCREARHN